MVKNDESQYNSITNITRGAVSIQLPHENGGGMAIYNNAGKNVGMFASTDIGGCQLTHQR